MYQKLRNKIKSACFWVLRKLGYNTRLLLISDEELRLQKVREAAVKEYLQMGRDLHFNRASILDEEWDLKFKQSDERVRRRFRDE